MSDELNGPDAKASDGPCDDCGRRYPPWWAPHALWNLTLGGPDARDDPGGMLCPTCFLLRAPKGIWYLSPSVGASVIAEARREAMINFATWLSEQDELDVFTADEAVDQFLRSDA